jgi:hypothetical protein
MRVYAAIMRPPEPEDKGDRLLVDIMVQKEKEKAQQAMVISCRPDPTDPNRLIIDLTIKHGLKGIYTSFTID